MFWGINLKPNCKYTQTANKSFHISQAALNADTSEGGSNQLYISCENQKILICTLRKDICEQVMLDLNFAEGNEICFQSIGSGSVSLSGYLIDEPNPFDDVDESDDQDVEEEVDLRNTLNSKAQKKIRAAAKAAAVANKEEVDDDEEDEEDSDFIGDISALNDDDDDSDEDDEDEDEGEDDEGDESDDEGDDDDEAGVDEEEDESEEEIAEPKAKQAKLEKKPKQPQQNGVAKPTANGEKKSKKDQKKQKQEQQKQPQQNAAGGERVITGGVRVEDVRVGNGTEAKNGKRVQVYYEGRLKSNNKVFDSMKQGAGFKFGIGRGEVIKGWEVGVAGMKVGGKRRITCPPHMAYGARGYPPSIPPNSTLVFDIELKGVN